MIILPEQIMYSNIYSSFRRCIMNHRMIDTLTYGFKVFNIHPYDLRSYEFIDCCSYRFMTVTGNDNRGRCIGHPGA